MNVIVVFNSDEVMPFIISLYDEFEVDEDFGIITLYREGEMIAEIMEYSFFYTFTSGTTDDQQEMVDKLKDFFTTLNGNSVREDSNGVAGVTRM